MVFLENSDFLVLGKTMGSVVTSMCGEPCSKTKRYAKKSALRFMKRNGQFLNFLVEQKSSMSINESIFSFLLQILSVTFTYQSQVQAKWISCSSSSQQS